MGFAIFSDAAVYVPYAYVPYMVKRRLERSDPYFETFCLFVEQLERV
jgi:hypothetical protein